MFSWWLTLSGHRWITNEPLPLIGHTISQGWRARSLQTLRSKFALNEKFTVMHLVFSSKTLLWSRHIDSSQFCFKSLLFIMVHQRNYRAAHKRLKWRDGKKSRRVKDKLLISDVLSAFHTDIHNFLGLLRAALFRLVDPSTRVLSPHLCGVNCTIMTCSRMIRDICSCTCA